METPQPRASGQTAGEESATEEGATLGERLGAEMPESRKWRTPGFRRMRTDWLSEDVPILQRAHKYASDRILLDFPDVFVILEEIYQLVREIEVDENGRQRTLNGLPVYRRSPYGYIEDWTRLTLKEREEFFFKISTRLFGWQMKAEDIYLEAMLSKTQWEERYSLAYDSPKSGTMGEREAKGKIEAIDERYFAVLRSAYSRRADGIIRHMENLCHRLAQGVRTV